MKKDSLAIQFSAWVRGARRSVEMSQSDLAQATGLHTSYISALETGKRSAPSFDKADQVCQVLGTSLWKVLQQISEPEIAFCHAGVGCAQEYERLLMRLRDQIDVVIPLESTSSPLARAKQTRLHGR